MVNCLKRFKLFISLSSLAFLILFAFFSKTVFFNQVFSVGGPSAPTDLLTEGATSPSNVTDLTPEFSAVYNDPDEADVANKYQIQVDDNPDFSSTLWDSGSSGTAMSDCSEGSRCADISYAGSTLSDSATYYWRIKYWDDEGTEGEWSNTGFLNTDLDFQSVDGPNFSQEDLAYSTTLTPSSTSEETVLTLTSGNWNDNAKVSAGCQVTGNGGVATIIDGPTASSTINARVETNFSDTSGITSGNWHLYCTQINSAEQLVLNDFQSRKDFDNTGYGQMGYVAAAQVDTDKILLAYGDSDTGSEGEAVVASVDGDAISYGNPVRFTTVGINELSLAKINTNKFLIAFSEYDSGSGSFYGKAVVASVSGTTIVFGNSIAFNSNATESPAVAQLAADKALIAYSDGSDSDYGKAVVASVSGTTIVLGEAVTFNEDSTPFDISAAQINTNKALIGFIDDPFGDSYAQAIVASVSDTTISYGSAVNVTEEATNGTSVTKLDTDKALVAYDPSSTGGAAVVATISETTISLGSPAIFETHSRTGGISASSLDTGKAIIAYHAEAGDYGYAKVASVSDTTITYGVRAEFNAAYIPGIATAQAATDKAIFLYEDRGNSNAATGILASVSDTTISYSSEYAFNVGSQIDYVGSTQISDNKVLIVWRDQNEYYGKAVVASVSGAVISYGDIATFSTGNTSSISVSKLDTDKAIIAYGKDNPGYARVASVSGTTISYGTEYQFEASSTSQISTAPLGTDKAIIAYYDHSSGDGLARVASVSGTDISYGDIQTFNAGGSFSVSANQLDTDKALIAYYDNSDNAYGKSVVASVSGTDISVGSEATFNSNATDFIFSAQAGTDKSAIIFSSWDGDENYEGSYVIMASVSDTTISYGSPQSLGSYIIPEAITQLGTDKVLINYQNSDFDLGVVVGSSSGTAISLGNPLIFYSPGFNGGNRALSNSLLTTDKAFIAFNRVGAIQSYGSGMVISFSGTDIYDDFYVTGNYYTTATSDLNQIDVSSWSNINSLAVGETVNGQAIDYGVSFNDRTTWKIYDGTGGDAGWRPIARDNAGTWEYNANTTAGATDITWTSASTNTQFGALDEAFQVTANQMTGTEFNALTDAQFEESGGFAPGSTGFLDFAFGLKTILVTSTPIIDQITINYDGRESFTTSTLNPETTPTPTPTSTQTGQSGSSSSGPPGPPVCGDTRPSGSPNLFQINVNDTQAKLYFVPVANTNNYYIAYSEKPNTFEHGTETNQGYAPGVLSFSINHLRPSTVYYFKIRGQNGCMAGDWSQEMSVRTRAKGLVAMIPFYKNAGPKWLPSIKKPTMTVQPEIKPTPTEIIKTEEPKIIEKPKMIEATPTQAPRFPTFKIPEVKKRCFLWWCW